ncbi:MAG: redoxin domain-containing protein [Gammaproteobacteria bacterium]|jgi:peroxiredoxin
MSSLKIGEPVLDFIKQDVNGKPIRLTDYRGRKVLLSFFRFASCPFCTVRFVRLANEVQHYAEAGLDIIGVFESSADYIHKYIGRRGLPFPVIADPEGELYSLYGVKKSIPGMMLGMLRMPTLLRALFDRAYKMGVPDASIMRIPADFLIEPDMTIGHTYYGSDIGDHVPFKTIEKFIEKPARRASLAVNR